MGHKVVAHARKIKTTVGLANVAAHNARDGVYDGRGAPIDPKPDYISRLDRAHLNDGNTVTAASVLRNYRRRLADAERENLENGDKWRKPQKNASAAVELVISASPEWFSDKTEREVRKYFTECREYLERRFGAPNLLQWATHHDETTPHMHLLLTPIIKTEMGNKFSSSELLGGRDGLRRLQDDLAAIGAKWGLERGVEGSKARHTDQRDWIAKKTRELEEKEKQLKMKELLLSNPGQTEKTILDVFSDIMAQIPSEKHLQCLKDARTAMKAHIPVVEKKQGKAKPIQRDDTSNSR